MSHRKRRPKKKKLPPHAKVWRVDPPSEDPFRVVDLYDRTGRFVRRFASLVECKRWLAGQKRRGERFTYVRFVTTRNGMILRIEVDAWSGIGRWLSGGEVPSKLRVEPPAHKLDSFIHLDYAMKDRAWWRRHQTEGGPRRPGHNRERPVSGVTR